MPEPASWRPDRYRGLLHLKARQLQLDPRLQQRFDASDLVQETLLKAHENRAQFNGQTEAQFVGWLQGILDNVALDEIRKAHAQRRDVNMEQSICAVSDSSLQFANYLEDQKASPPQLAEWSEFLLHFVQALEQLSDEQREVVLLRDVKSISVAEIAKQMKTTEKSVAGLLLRGRRQLRTLLASYQ